MSVVLPPGIETFLTRFDGGTHSRKPIAVFDCDGTIIKGDIGEAMFYHQVERFLVRMNPANIWLDHPKREELNTLYTALMQLPAEKRASDRRFISLAEMMLEWYFSQLRDDKTEKACSDIVRLFTKFTEEEVELIARRTLEEELATPLGTRRIGRHTIPTGIRYIIESGELLRQLQFLGFDIWAISGSNIWSTRAVFGRLGIPRDRILGIDLEVSSTTFAPRVTPPVPVLQGKVDLLRRFTEVKPMIVVSDSTYDIPLFNYSSHLKVLINSRMENSYTFFKEGNIVQDDSWVVVEHPTFREEIVANG